MNSPTSLIVGIGSSHGDDQVGWSIARRLAENLELQVAEVRYASSPMHLLDWLDGFEQLFVCDACHATEQAGKVHRWTWPSAEAFDVSWSATHEISLPAVLQLAQQLGRLPGSVQLWAVEIEQSLPMHHMTPAVRSAISVVAERIFHELACGRQDETHRPAKRSAGICTNNR